MTAALLVVVGGTVDTYRAGFYLGCILGAALMFAVSVIVGVYRSERRIRDRLHHLEALERLHRQGQRR